MVFKKLIILVSIVLSAIQCKKNEDDLTTQLMIISALTGCQAGSSLSWDLYNYRPTTANQFVQIGASTTVCGDAEAGFAYVQAPETGTYTVSSSVKSSESKDAELTLYTLVPAVDTGHDVFTTDLEVFVFSVGGGYDNAHTESRTDTVTLNQGDLLRFTLSSDSAGSSCVGGGCNNRAPSFNAVVSH